MANALEEANATLANENATAKEVEAAKAALSSAMFPILRAAAG